MTSVAYVWETLRLKAATKSVQVHKDGPRQEKITDTKKLEVGAVTLGQNGYRTFLQAPKQNSHQGPRRV